MKENFTNTFDLCYVIHIQHIRTQPCFLHYILVYINNRSLSSMKLTGYKSCCLPVLMWYIFLKIFSASSRSPCDNKNFGLSGRNISRIATTKLGSEQTRRNMRHELYLKDDEKYPVLLGIIDHARPENKELNTVYEHCYYKK